MQCKAEQTRQAASATLLLQELQRNNYKCFVWFFFFAERLMTRDTTCQSPERRRRWLEGSKAQRPLENPNLKSFDTAAALPRVKKNEKNPFKAEAPRARLIPVRTGRQAKHFGISLVVLSVTFIADSRAPRLLFALMSNSLRNHAEAFCGDDWSCSRLSHECNAHTVDRVKLERRSSCMYRCVCMWDIIYWHILLCHIGDTEWNLLRYSYLVSYFWCL